MPDNLEEPAHRLMRDIAGDALWAEKLAPALATRQPMASADWYYALLRGHCSRVDIWRTTYYHSLAGGPAAVVAWFKGSGLRPFLDRLNEAEQAEYLSRYETEVALAYPPLPDGTVLLPFPRLFIVATR
jgi:trans-aconitate 2-methyltransferase